jgi:hypothetical protein
MKKILLAMVLSVAILSGISACADDFERDETVVQVLDESAVTDDTGNKMNYNQNIGSFKVYSNTAFKDGEKFVIRQGDDIFVSGDGCLEKQVSVNIYKKGDNNRRYTLGIVEPNSDEWEWSGIVRRTIWTSDDTEVELEDGFYDIEVEIGETTMAAGAVIEIKKEYYRDFEGKSLESGDFKGTVLEKDNGLYLYDEEAESENMIYSKPMFKSLIGLSPQKNKIAFFCGTFHDNVIGIYDMDKGSMTYIELENPYAYQDVHAWWHNDGVMVASGHVNPSARGYVCYDALSGEELSYACGWLLDIPKDGRYILFRLTPHFVDNPIPDNIASSNGVVDLYTVENPDTKIESVKLSDDGKKLMFIETIEKSGGIIVNLADINENGTLLQDNKKYKIDNKSNNSFHDVLMADDFSKATFYMRNRQNGNIEEITLSFADSYEDGYVSNSYIPMHSSSEILWKGSI